MTTYTLGLDVGGTKILAVVAAADGAIVDQWRTDTPAAAGGQAVLQTLGEVGARALAAFAGISAVGVSAAGQIDFNAGLVTYGSPNIPGWTGTPVGPALSSRLGLPVIVDNDGNAAAYGESWAGAGRGASSLVAVTIGTGVGGGIVLDGTVLRGGRWRGGEIGHIIVAAEGAVCNCGQTGCLEMYASGSAIARLARAARPGWGGDARAVFAAADAGEAWAEAILRRSTRYLAAGLVSLGSVIDPDLFLLSGGVATQPRYLDLVREALADPVVSGQRGFEPARLQLASLGEAAGAVGAAGLAWGIKP